MKSFLIPIALITLSTTITHACPYCNIHNYLHTSVKSSTLIYKGKILKAKGKDDALVQVVEIIRSGKSEQIAVGQIRQEPLYHPKDEIGQTYIFSNPVFNSPTYPVLSVDFEEEIRFLVDSTRMITTVEEAIRRTEGVSTYSTDMGLAYVREHYDSCYPHLVGRIQKLRAIAFENPDCFYAGHRIKNLTAALFISDNEWSRNFFLAEIDTVMASKPMKVNWRNIPVYNEAIQGDYLRAMLMHSKDFEKTHAVIRLKIREAIEHNETSNLVFCAYAMGFDDYSPIAFDELSKEQRNFIALGFYYAAKSNRMNWANLKKNPGLIDLAVQLSTSKELTELIRKNFDLE